MAWTLSTFPDAAAFLEQAGPLLGKAEAENNLILGLANRLQREPEFEGPAYYAVLCAGGEIVGASLRTSPPRRLLLSRAPAAALEPLLDDVLELKFTGVNGPVQTASDFATAWSLRTGCAAAVRMNLRIYQLDSVSAVPQPPGRFRVATEGDIDTLVPFVERFSEAIGDPPPTRFSTAKRIANRSLFVWEDGEPVSCANAAGPTLNGMRVNLVYTPPALRGNGYATACVAALSQRLLDAGKRFCFLYTDLANPTSNSIYQKIGYRPVCDCVDIEFDR